LNRGRITGGADIAGAAGGGAGLLLQAASAKAESARPKVRRLGRGGELANLSSDMRHWCRVMDGNASAAAAGAAKARRRAYRGRASVPDKKPGRLVD